MILCVQPVEPDSVTYTFEARDGDLRPASFLTRNFFKRSRTGVQYFRPLSLYSRKPTRTSAGGVRPGKSKPENTSSSIARGGNQRSCCRQPIVGWKRPRNKKISELFRYEVATGAILQFLKDTDVRRIEKGTLRPPTRLGRRMGGR